MESKQIARYLGAMSIEERVQIIKCLLEVSPDGREMLDIAARIELGPAAVFKQLESLMGLELVTVKTLENNKVYFANAELLEQLFGYMYRYYGPAREPVAPAVDDGGS
jgi:hypothetical protein